MPTQKQYTVLLIDDSAEDRATYCRYLQRGSDHAYHILEAASAATGLELYQRSLPDAVLLDYSLPDRDGLDVLTVLQQPGKQRVPVLMLTGQGNETIAAQSIKCGAQDYLVKANLTTVGLCRAIEQAIEQFQLQQRLRQQEQQQQMIGTIALRIRQSLQLEEILETTVAEVQQFLNADRVLLYQFQPDMSGTMIAESVLPGWTVALGSQIEDTCFQHNAGGEYQVGKKRAIDNIYQAGLTACHVQLLERFDVKANLVAPILVRDKLWGLLIAHQCSAPRQWQTTELDLLDQLGVQIAIAIQQATTYQQVLADRQQIETILRKSKQRYATLTEMAPVGIFQTDAEGHCLYASQRWCQIAGLTPAEAEGLGWVNGIHPDDREFVASEWYGAAQENRPFYLEYRFQNAAGQITWALGQATAERGAAGEIIGYVGTITDINERKATEQALKVQRDFNQLIAEITSRFVDLSPNDLDTEIERTLQLIGEITQVDTSYLFIFDENQHTVQMTHEWCKPDYSRQIAKAQAIPQTAYPWSNALLKQREIVYVPYVADLSPEAAIDQATWQQFNLIALLLVPLIQKSIVTGFMGFASYSQAVDWEEETIRLLRVMGQTIANAQERTQDEYRLYVSEERLRLALAAANQGLYDLNMQTGEAIVTPEYATMLGYDPSTFEETNARWIERLHPDDRETVSNTYGAYVAGTLPEYKVEFRQRTQTGKWKWILSVGRIVSWDATGQPLRMLGTHTDISDHKQAETERLRAEKLCLELNLLENILDNILAGYWDWDISNNQEYLSPGLKRMFGYEDHELPNSPETWQRLIFAKDLPGVLDCFDRHVQSHGEIPFYNEVRYHHQDGSTVWVICSGKVIEWDEMGHPLRMIGCHIDITEAKRDEVVRKQAEAKILQTTAQLEASNRELEAFAYSVSHDLRSPLRAIDGFSKALLEDYGEQFDQEGKDYFDRIRHNVSRMGMLIDDLLRLSRVSRSDMRYSAVNLSAIVQDQIEELQMSEPDRQVKAVITPEAIVSADATLMRVVLTNLLQNAWKFTSHHATALIEFGVTQLEGELAYFVRDDGAGFDMAYANMLFGVFQRLHNTHEFPGTGIGLATVQRAIHRHGGRVWAEAAVEQGATIYFTVPNIPMRTGA
jgi:PAS domain S-box-containing protein